MTIGALLALCSAAVWGSGDYCGGRATTRSDPFQVLALAAASGIAMLVAAAFIAGESWTLSFDLLWAAVAGISGSLGIVSLYRGLAIGNAASVAPMASVIAAAVPVVYGVAANGAPRGVQIAGFVLALAGIWLVASAASTGSASRRGLWLGTLAGIGFGAFMVLIAQVDVAAVYVPLVVARTMMLTTAVVTLGARRMALASPVSNPTALLAGLLDTGGNVLYLLARQHVRLDIAAVLSSLYPVATVALARIVGHETITRTQWLGAAACLIAVLLITA